MIDYDENFWDDFQACLDEWDSEDFAYYDSVPPALPKSAKSCRHDWKSITLLTSTVFDCKKCGIKKEDV